MTALITSDGAHRSYSSAPCSSASATSSAATGPTLASRSVPFPRPCTAFPMSSHCLSDVFSLPFRCLLTAFVFSLPFRCLLPAFVFSLLFLDLSHCHSTTFHCLSDVFSLLFLDLSHCLSTTLYCLSDVFSLLFIDLSLPLHRARKSRNLLGGWCGTTPTTQVATSHPSHTHHTRTHPSVLLGAKAESHQQRGALRAFLCSAVSPLAQWRLTSW